MFNSVFNVRISKKNRSYCSTDSKIAISAVDLTYCHTKEPHYHTVPVPVACVEAVRLQK